MESPIIAVYLILRDLVSNTSFITNRQLNFVVKKWETEQIVYFYYEATTGLAMSLIFSRHGSSTGPTAVTSRESSASPFSPSLNRIVCDSLQRMSLG